MSRLRRALVILLLLPLILTILLGGLLYLYEKEVKSAILTELNKHLKVQVVVQPGDIDLTWWRSFPDCALDFRKVLVLESSQKKKKDTLLYSPLLSLRFSLLDLWNKKYDIRSIAITGGTIKLKNFSDGSSNYEFWKQSQPQTPSEPVAFDLQKVTVSDVQFVYTHFASKFRMQARVGELQLKGHFSENQYELQTHARMLVEEMRKDETYFLRQKTVALNLVFDVNGDHYTISQANLAVNELQLALQGNMVYANELENLAFRFEAPSLSIAPLLSLLPQNYTDMVKEYKSKGNLFLKGKYDWKKTGKYELAVAFGINNGDITYTPNEASANKVNVDGQLFMNQATSKLELKNISLALKNDLIEGSCVIRDFTHPYLQFEARADADLANVYAFFPLDTVEHVSGRLRLNAKVEGLTENLKVGGAGRTYSLQLNTAINNLELKFRQDAMPYRVPGGELSADNGDVHVKNLQLQRGESRLSVSGSIPGLFRYIVEQDAPLVIRGSMDAERIRMEDFMNPSSSAGSSAGEQALIPGNVNFILDARIGQFEFGKFTATDIAGDIEIKNQKALVNEVTLKAVQGAATVNAFADNSKGRLDLTLQAQVDRIDIRELFTSMNNFGQQVLQDKHLKGQGSATLNVSGSWSNKLEVSEKTIHADCDVVIENGELNNFEPMMAVSKYVSVDELRRIRFNTLRSSVEISDRIIKIPATHISNSALDIDFWGTHTFDNNVDYHIRLVISDLINKKRNKRDDEFGPIESDADKRRMAHILMKGNLDDPKITYDRKGMKDKIRTDIRQEKTSVKKILKDEFGLFRKDSLPRTKSPAAVFELEDQKKPEPKKTLELKKKTEDEDF